MKTRDEKEELRDSDTEITLGMKSILGIFFGLALVCGVFFGFGYSLGRDHNSVKSTLPAATVPEASAVAPSPIRTVIEGASLSSASGSPAQAAGKPSAVSTAVVAQPSAPATAALVPAVQTQPVPAAPTAATPVANTTTPASPANTMVQIAAVSRPGDASALVAALRKLGYSAYAHSEAGDSLIHVQIGPFATRDQAKAMRARLLSDGYNAILK